MGCATYRDDLDRGQQYYKLNQYNNALSVWRVLESDWDSLNYADQARYAYLRGMTDVRLGFRADARHWLAVAKAVSAQHPGGLDAQASAQLEQSLGELNRAVYAAGQAPSPTATGVELTPVAATVAPVQPIGADPSTFAPAAAPQPNLPPASGPAVNPSLAP